MREVTSIIQGHSEVKIISLNNKEIDMSPSTKERVTEVIVPSGKSFFEISVINIRRGSFIYDGGKFGFELDLQPDHTYAIVFKDIISYLEIELLIIDNTSGVGKIIRAKQTDTSKLWKVTF